MRHAALLLILAMLPGCIPAGYSSRHEVSRPGPAFPRHRGYADRPEAPVLKRVRGGKYRLERPWTVDLNGRQWHLPKGYTTNGITAPMRIKMALGDGVDHPETWAAVYHDWLFTQPGMSRHRADELFRDLLLAYGVSPEKTRIMYTTVSLYSMTKAIR